LPRITSQKNRQMILTTGTPLNPAELPEKLELYNEQGDPLYIGLQESGRRLITPPTRWFPGSRRQERLSLFLVGG
jgi:hypothetical protein